MQTVIVDASVLLAGWMKGGSIRRVLLKPPEAVALAAPEYLRLEAESKILRAATRLGVSLDVAAALLDDILVHIRVIPVEAWEPTYDEAQKICAKHSAFGDEPYVAAALALDSPVWTFDPDFDRIARSDGRIRVWTTGDVLKTVRRL